MDAELKNLQDRPQRSARREPSGWAAAGSSAASSCSCCWALARVRLQPAERRRRRWRCVRVQRAQSTAGGGAERVMLNATGYIVAAHKIQVASKVVGQGGVDRRGEGRPGQRGPGDRAAGRRRVPRAVAAGHGAAGQAAGAAGRGAERLAARGDRAGARRIWSGARRTWTTPGSRWSARSSWSEAGDRPPVLDDAQARYDAAGGARERRWRRPTNWCESARARSRSTPLRGQVEQASGAVAFAETQLANTVIRAPVTGTILERAVEKGEFVTTSFVGERGAKGYVVSLADLNDLEVELDISQNDFAKLGSEPARLDHHRRVSRPQVRGLHQRDLARGQPAEGHRAGEGEDAASPDEYLRPGDERQRGVPVRREAAAAAPAAREAGGVRAAVGGAGRRGVRRAGRQGRAARR